MHLSATERLQQQSNRKFRTNAAYEESLAKPPRKPPLDVAHEKYYEQLGHPKARVDGTPPTDDVVAAVVAAARALGAPLGGAPARKTPSAERA